MLELLIRGGQIASEFEVLEGSVGVQGGKIAGLYSPGEEPEAREVIDAASLLVTPGGVEIHPHLFEPEEYPREGFKTGSWAAAAGGITTVVEQPQSYPPANYIEIFERKRQLADEKCVVDFALWGGIDHSNWDQMPLLHEAGAVAFKGFMIGGNESLPRLDDGEFLDVMRIIASFDGVIGIHCENDDILNRRQAALKAEGRKDPLAHYLGAPPIAEYEAINRAIILAEESGVRLHIVHLSTARGAELVKAAKARGQRVTVETCPHYLTLDLDDLVRLGPYGRCGPPLRSRENVEELWKYVFDGTIDCLAADHAPYSFEDKDPGLENIFDAFSGIHGIQTSLPVFLSEGVHKRGLRFEDFVRLSSAGPARVMGLYPQKGAIRPGSDADLVLWDTESSWEIRGEDMFYLHKWTPFEGYECKGKVVRTIVRGQTVYGDGEIKTGLGFGQFVRPARRD